MVAILVTFPAGSVETAEGEHTVQVGVSFTSDFDEESVTARLLEVTLFLMDRTNPHAAETLRTFINRAV